MLTGNAATENTRGFDLYQSSYDTLSENRTDTISVVDTRILTKVQVVHQELPRHLQETNAVAIDLADDPIGLCKPQS